MGSYRAFSAVSHPHSEILSFHAISSSFLFTRRNCGIDAGAKAKSPSENTVWLKCGTVSEYRAVPFYIPHSFKSAITNK